MNNDGAIKDRSVPPIAWQPTVAVNVLRPYVIEVTFADGTSRQIDMETELWGEVFEPLRDPALFAQAAVDPELGTVSWPTGADLAPEFLYFGDEGPATGFADPDATPDRQEGTTPVTVRPEPTRDRPPSGEPVDPPPPALWPARVVHEGRHALVEPLDGRVHAVELYTASHGDEAGRRIWDHLPYGPFPSLAAFGGWLRDCSATADPLFFAVRDRRSGQAAGVASYLNIVPKHGTIEIGHIWFGPALQDTPAATEALFLLIRHALDDLGYRRMEWKCNALNQGSRRAAVRLGFRFEGIFYQHMITKGRNRDTAWYSILDDEWPRLRATFEIWLDPSNFDAAGRQRTSLSALNG